MVLFLTPIVAKTGSYPLTSSHCTLGATRV
jgi:hypothetical protein